MCVCGRGTDPGEAPELSPRSAHQTAPFPEQGTRCLAGSEDPARLAGVPASPTPCVDARSYVPAPALAPEGAGSAPRPGLLWAGRRIPVWPTVPLGSHAVTMATQRGPQGWNLISGY